MDDFNVSSLHESKNEWGARLLIILTPLIIEGFKSIFDESYALCQKNREQNKYLMTFQNLIARIPKWNDNIIDNEYKRIIERSRCTYLEDLISCIHIIQLKLLTAIRVGQQQKKIDIDIPQVNKFIHNVYINSARKIYKNIYLYELGIPALQQQKNNRELECIIQECILNTVRENIPVENILKIYMDETIENETIEEIKEEIISEPNVSSDSNTNNNANTNDNTISNEELISDNIIENNSLKFNDMDTIVNEMGDSEMISAPKTDERLEEISNIRNMQRSLENDDDDDNEGQIIISNENIPINDMLDIQDINHQIDDIGNIEILN